MIAQGGMVAAVWTLLILCMGLSAFVWVGGVLRDRRRARRRRAALHRYRQARLAEVFGWDGLASDG